MWGGAPRCDFSLAPGSASDWPTVGTDSRCEEESRTRESGMATQRVWMWGGAPRCDFSLAPGSASDWPTAGTDSRCEEESRTWKRGMTRATGKGEKI